MLLWKEPDFILLHAGKNDLKENTSESILYELIKLKNYIQGILLNVTITLFKSIKQLDDAKAKFTLIRLTQNMDNLNVKLLDNSNIKAIHIGQNRFVFKRFVFKRFVFKRFVFKRFVFKRFAFKRFVFKRFVFKRFVFKRFVFKRFVFKR